MNISRGTLRQILADNFPGIEFVISGVPFMSSLYKCVDWKGGPKKAAVAKVLEPYKYVEGAIPESRWIGPYQIILTRA